MKVGDKLFGKDNKYYTVIRYDIDDVEEDFIYYFVLTEIYDNERYYSSEIGIYDHKLNDIFFTEKEIRKLKLGKINESRG